MRIPAALLCVLLLFSSCAITAETMPVGIPKLEEPPETPVATGGETQTEAYQPEVDDEPAEEEPEPEPEYALETVYIQDADMTVEQVVEAYFEQMYLSYSELVYIDVSNLLDMTNSANRNMLKWTETLILRRRLLRDTGLCYVDTEMLPYSIEFDAEPEDDRMELWRDWLVETGNEVVHFRVRGETGKAYPPIMAVNSQHTIFFKRVDDMWKITLHYFPGSVRKFTRAGTIVVPEETEMMKQLEAEFAHAGFSDEPVQPPGFKPYDAEEAVRYAFEFTETPNPDFYDIGDWIGNCANFISQCIWAGFGGETMTTEWSGGDGGTIAWENVNNFWGYITSGQELRGEVITSAGELQNGDIVQMRTASIKGEENRFTHMMIVVDEGSMMLAQNSPACFVYYSDLVNAKTRMIRPSYLYGGN